MKQESAQESESFTAGAIEGVIVRDLRKFHDERGWLMELFRHDELRPEFYPTMAYISATGPGVTRGPHEHVDQADLFYFVGPSNFKIRMWDKRAASKTLNHVMTLVIGETNPKSVLVPAGVVHAYQNVGDDQGIIVNCPNRLYAGENKRQEVDEIRHEADPNTVFRMD